MRKTWLSWKTALTWWLSSRAESRSWPKGFSMTTATRPVLRLRHLLRAEILDDAGKEFRGRGEVEEAVGADALLFGDAVELGVQSGVVGGIVEVEGKVADV